MLHVMNVISAHWLVVAWYIVSIIGYLFRETFIPNLKPLHFEISSSLILKLELLLFLNRNFCIIKVFNELQINVRQQTFYFLYPGYREESEWDTVKFYPDNSVELFSKTITTKLQVLINTLCLFINN